jgi:hypothetical protein
MQTQNIFIAHPTTTEQINVLKAIVKSLKIKFEISKDENKSYNPEFVAKIKKSKQQFKDGNFSTLSLDDIWKND